MMVARSEPNADVRAEILAAALKVLRAKGVRGLTVGDVLIESGLGTRAFYRHFTSKDQLVLDVFAEATKVEVRRLQVGVEGRSDPIEAIAAWIDRRLDLAFDDTVQSDLRHLSNEAQSLLGVSPQAVFAIYTTMLAPLARELRRGRDLGVLTSTDPDIDAQSIQAVVWSHIEKQWATGNYNRAEVRSETLRFCLRAVGVDAAVIEHVVLFSD